jgi:hypothetical protein
MMNKTILFISVIILSAAVSNLARAQEANQDRDPFFSDGPRSAATGTINSQLGNGWGRDPFARPFAGAAVAQQNLGTASQGKKLTGIIYGEDNRIAILDGETIREGDKVGDLKLAQIRPNSVVLMDSAGNRTEVILENFSMQK